MLLRFGRHARSIPLAARTEWQDVPAGATPSEHTARSRALAQQADQVRAP
jgi:hypothetical protein